jgi:hypothetical protein
MPTVDDFTELEGTTTPYYRVYLLRCWREPLPDNQRSPWRFVVVSAQSHQRRAFRNLEEVFVCLRDGLQCGGDPLSDTGR